MDAKIKNTLATTAWVTGGIVSVALMGAVAFAPRQTATSSVTPTVASNVVERYDCEQAVKAQLRDPDSYQRIEFAGGQDWAMLSFRARNGFGGYDSGYARCDRHGDQVTADLNPGREAAAEYARGEVQKMQQEGLIAEF